MRAKQTKPTPPPVVVEISGDDRDLLANAYKAGLIIGWRQDPGRGYRLTLGNRRDEYVEATKLSRYLERLRNDAA